MCVYIYVYIYIYIYIYVYIYIIYIYYYIYINHVTQPMTSVDISIFSLEICNFCYIKKYIVSNSFKFF